MTAARSVGPAPRARDEPGIPTGANGRAEAESVVNGAGELGKAFS